ncbi:MAG: hypothetical protein ABIE84_01865 [bacterium]
MKRTQLTLLVVLILSIILAGLALLPEKRLIIDKFSVVNENQILLPNSNIDANLFDVCVLELTQAVAYEPGAMLFTSQYFPQFSYNLRFDFDSGPANRLNKIYIYAPSHRAWVGIIKDILIIPSTNGPMPELQRVLFIRSNPWTKIRALSSNFTRYYDPKLGSVFALASPLFFNNSYNVLMGPWIWGIIAILLAVAIGCAIYKPDPIIFKISLLGFIILFLLLWLILDLRNNTYYLKGMRRDASQYWGKSLSDKRGIVNLSSDFISFMRFCDEAIPSDGKIINYVSEKIPGTADGALHHTQLYFNLRPRLNTTKEYYVVYGTEQSKLEIPVQGLKMFKKFHDLAYILTK